MPASSTRDRPLSLRTRARPTRAASAEGGSPTDASTYRRHAARSRSRRRRALRDLADARVPRHRQLHIRRQGSLVQGPAVGPGVLGHPPRRDLVLGRRGLLERPRLRVVVRHLHQPVHGDLRVLRDPRAVDDWRPSRRDAAGRRHLLLPELPGRPRAVRRARDVAPDAGAAAAGADAGRVEHRPQAAARRSAADRARPHPPPALAGSAGRADRQIGRRRQRRERREPIDEPIRVSGSVSFMSGRSTSAARPARGPRRPGAPSVASSQSMSGSARNHVRWRFANATLRRASSSIAASSVELAVEDRPRLAVADRARTPGSAGSNRSRSARASSMRPASNWARARAAIRSRVRRPGRRRARARRPGPGSRAAGGRGASPASSAISRARTTRRGLRRSTPAASAGASAAQAVDERREAVGVEVAPRGRRGPPGRSAARRCRGRARPRAGRARCRRRGSRRRRARRSSARTPRACVAKSATLNGSSGSTRSRPWCGTRARSAAVALAVPMSRPRKTWRESAEMISAGRPAAMSASASAIASAVLPVAVAPAMTTSGGAARHAPTSAPRSAYGPAWSMRTATVATDERRRRRRDGRACCRGSGRTARRPGAPASPRPSSCSCDARRRRPRRPGPRPRGRATPGCARGRSPPGRASSSLSRRRLTSAGTSSASRVAGRARAAASRPPRRPGRSGPSRAARSVASNWASVSPQNPTMTSVETVMPGHGLADPGQPLQVVLDRVLAAHPAQDGVVARLDRQVEVLADDCRSRPAPR